MRARAFLMSVQGGHLTSKHGGAQALAAPGLGSCSCEGVARRFRLPPRTLAIRGGAPRGAGDDRCRAPPPKVPESISDPAPRAKGAG